MQDILILLLQDLHEQHIKWYAGPQRSRGTWETNAVQVEIWAHSFRHSVYLRSELVLHVKSM
jgi:hypothetical protein